MVAEAESREGFERETARLGRWWIVGGNESEQGVEVRVEKGRRAVRARSGRARSVLWLQHSGNEWCIARGATPCQPAD